MELTKENLEETLKKLETDSVIAANQIFPELLENINKLSEMLDVTSNNRIKRNVRVGLAFGALPIDTSDCKKSDHEFINTFKKIMELHIQLAFAAIFARPKTKEEMELEASN